MFADKDDLEKLKREIVIEKFEKDIFDNVQNGVEFYVLISMIQSLASKGQLDIVKDIERKFAQGIEALKKDCGKWTGVTDSELIEKINIPGLIENVSLPYKTVINHCIKMCENEKK